MKRRVLLATLLTLVLTLSCAQAQVSMEASAGYRGTVPGGRWFPLEITITNEDEAFDGVVAVELIRNYEVYDRFECPVSVGTGETSVRLPLRLAMAERSLQVTLSAGDGIVAETTAPVREIAGSYAYFIGVLGGSDELVSSLCSANVPDVLGRADQLVAVPLDEEMDRLTQRELDAFAALVIDGYDVGALPEEQQALLLDWLNGGGTVILGPGKAGASSTGWFEAQTGVRFGEAMEDSGLMAALMRYADATYEAEEAADGAYVLDAGEDGAAYDDQARCILARSEVGEGQVLSCGFSLTDGTVLTEARTNALWQRLLLAADAVLYSEGFDRGDNNTFYVNGVCEQMRVSEGVSILPAVAVLAAYVLIAGAGLFILMRRIDRSRLMWICLPVCAACAMGLVVLISGVLGLNEPTAASLRVIRFDEAGNATDQEGALVSYADQTRVRIEAEGAKEIFRTEYFSYYGSSYAQQNYTLRDTCTLGDRPAIELRAAAPWTQRMLTLTRDGANLMGSVSVRAWMEADGLHAVVENNTDVALCDAVLISSLGYASLGDLAAGEVREVSLLNPDEIVTIDGEQVIRDGDRLQYPASIGRVISACARPQSQTAEGSAKLSEAGERAASLKESLLRIAVSSSQEFDCFVVAGSPELPCAAILKDGERITRFAQESVVSVAASFEPVSAGGYFYYPEGTFAALKAEKTQTGYALGSPWANRYQDVGSGLLVGFDLSDVEGHIDSILLMSEWYGDSIRLEIYDWTAGLFVGLNGLERTTIGSDLIPRVVSAQGELLLRYTSESADGGIYNPTIIVEGWKEENGHDRVQ